MKELKYNIEFRLGDSDWEHDDWYMVSNYSAKEIDDAYNQASKIIGFDFTGEYCILDNIIEYEQMKDLEKHNIAPNEAYDVPSKEGYIIDTETYLKIFKNIVRLVLKDFDWKTRNLDSECVWSLDETGVGLYE